MTMPSIESVKKHLSSLVSFNTCNPPRNILQSGIVEYLKTHLADATVNTFNYGDGSINILAIKGKPKYLFNYHIDTVPVTEGWLTDPFQLVEKDDKLYALGACDIKGAAACMLACIEQGVSDYAVLFSSDEEHGNSTCIKAFLKEHHVYEGRDYQGNKYQDHDYKGVVVAEPTQAKAVLAHRGIITATLNFKAKSGHSSEPRALKDNANHQASYWVTKALNWAESKLDDSYEDLSGTCFNVGWIEGGVKPNVIAPVAHIKFGLRPLPGCDTTQLLNDLLISTGVKDSAAVGFNAPSLPAQGTVESNQKLAQDLGIDVGNPVNFWTEAALFSQAGYPAIVLGPGNIEQAHTANEWVELSELQKVTQQYWGILSHE